MMKWLRMSFLLWIFSCLHANATVPDISFTQLPTITDMSVGQSQTITYTIKNNTPALIRIFEIMIVSQDSLPSNIFSRNTNISNNCSNQIAGKASCNISYTINATQSGSVNRNLKIAIDTRLKQISSFIAFTISGSTPPAPTILTGLFAGGQLNTHAPYIYQYSFSLKSKANWMNISNGLPSFGAINAFALYNGSLFAAGFSQITSVSQPAVYVGKFDGTSWSNTFTNLAIPIPSEFFTLLVNNNLLYAGGSASTGGLVFFYDGTSWTNISDPGLPASSTVYSLAFYNNQLYAGGVDGSNNPFVRVFDGTSWTDVSSSSFDTFSRISSLIVYNGSLYAGESNFLGSSAVFVFNGSTWDTRNTGLDPGGVNSLTIFGNQLYAGGGGDGIAGFVDVFNVNTSTWSTVPGLTTPIASIVSTLAPSTTTLYAGGFPRPFVDGFNNSTWTDISSGLPSSTSDALNALIVKQN